jgi:hypothetical protein
VRAAVDEEHGEDDHVSRQAERTICPRPMTHDGPQFAIGPSRQWAVIHGCAVLDWVHVPAYT